MKIKILILLILVIKINIFAMEAFDLDNQLSQVTELEKLVESPTDEFTQAWKIANGEIASLKAIIALSLTERKIAVDKDKIPAELEWFIKSIYEILLKIEMVNKVKNCSKKCKLILLNVINNSEFDGANFFPKKIDKQEFLNKLLLRSSFFTTSNIDLVNLALSLKADVNFTDDHNINALIRSIRGPAEITMTLIQASSNINNQSVYGHTALMCAAEDNDRLKTEVLLNAGANPNLQDNKGNTALMMAITGNNFSCDEEMIQLLIENGTNINIKNKDGQTALDLAKQYERKKIIRMLNEARGKNKSWCNQS